MNLNQSHDERQVYRSQNNSAIGPVDANHDNSPRVRYYGYHGGQAEQTDESGVPHSNETTYFADADDSRPHDDRPLYGGSQ